MSGLVFKGYYGETNVHGIPDGEGVLYSDDSKLIFSGLWEMGKKITGEGSNC